MDNKETISIKGNITWSIIVAVFSFTTAIATLTSNYISLEKRVTTLETKQESIFSSIKNIEIQVSKIDSNLCFIKEQINKTLPVK